MKIVALCKTFDGGEWVGAMISSIYYEVDHIVFIHSDISWDGRKGNIVKKETSEWTKRYDGQNKIINLEFNSSNQTEQYNYGIEYINNYLDVNYIMIIDCDEIWDIEMLKISKNHLLSNHGAYTCKMKTYIKSPYYMIDKEEQCNPIVFLKKEEKLLGTRGNKCIDKFFMKDVLFHHFTLVRLNIQNIKDKIIASNMGDSQTDTKIKSVNVDEWISNKWDKLPIGKNLHITKNFEHCWNKIKVIEKNDLPNILFQHPYPIMELYEMSSKECMTDMPSGFLLIEDENILRKYSGGVIIDIGTYKGRSAWILSEQSEKVYTFDIFENIDLIQNKEYRDFYKTIFEKYPHYYEEVKKHLFIKTNIIVLNQLSTIIPIDIKQVDMLFIDGDHSYSGVKLDFDTWFHYVKVGGYILFHDSIGYEQSPEFEQQVGRYINKELKYNNKLILVDASGRITAWKKIKD